MRSSREVRASGCQCLRRNSPGFKSRHLPTQWNLRGDEAVLNTVHEIKKTPKNPPVTKHWVQMGQLSENYWVNTQMFHEQIFEKYLVQM
jgi:hypothetical protein